MKGLLFCIVLAFVLVTGCEKKIEGCTDISASNYDEEANTDNGSCIYKYYGEAVFWYDQMTMNSLNATGEAHLALYIDNSYAMGYYLPITDYETVAPDCSVNSATSLVKSFEFLSEFGQSYTYEFRKDDGTVLTSLPFFVTANTCTPVELIY